MRRLSVAAVVLVLAVTGCSTDRTGSASPAATPAVGGGSTAPSAGGSAPVAGASSGALPGAAGDQALAKDTKAICAQAVKTSGEFRAQVVLDQKMLTTAGKNPQGEAAQLLPKTKRDVQNYGFALTDMSKLVADPAVKKALADMSKEVGSVDGDVHKLTEAKLKGLRATLDKACE